MAVLSVLAILIVELTVALPPAALLVEQPLAALLVEQPLAVYMGCKIR
jgi:hypothetical protein